MPPDPQIRVLLRPLGSPLTIGMSGLAVGSLVQSGLDLNWIPASQTRPAGIALIAAPFVMQLLACVFAYLARDGAAGAALGVLSTSWLTIGAVYLYAGAQTHSGALALLLIGAGTILMLSSLVVAVANPLPGTIFALAGVRFVLTGAQLLSGSAGLRQGAGIPGLVLVALAAYGVLAFELEGLQRRTILPTLRRGPGRQLCYGEPSADSPGVLVEPGVRETL
jgi:succinate-acetate transporter protein